MTRLAVVFHASADAVATLAIGRADSRIVAMGALAIGALGTVHR